MAVFRVRGGSRRWRIAAASHVGEPRSRIFGPGRVGDTFEGRFELLSLHAALALIRLRPEAQAGAVAQGFVDQLFRDLDSGLREDGVGDGAVPKRVHKLASAFYGRLNVYAAALASGAGETLQEVVCRNVLGLADVPFGSPLSLHARRVAGAQAAGPWRRLLSDEGWTTFRGVMWFGKTTCPGLWSAPLRAAPLG